MSKFYLKNLQYNCILNNINLRKKKVYKFKSEIFFNNVQIFYYSDNAEEFNKKILLSKFYYIFKKMENMTGNLAFFKIIKIKTKNKKKIKKRSFLVIACNLYNNFDSFFNFFIINNFVTKINSLKSIKHLYKTNQEFLKKDKLNTLILLEKKLLYRVEIISKNFTFKKIKRRSKDIKSKRKKFYYKCINKFIPVFFYFKSSFVFYVYKFLSLLMLNELKLLLFLYKFYRNKFIKI